MLCHSERSEESYMVGKILRCAQNDSSGSIQVIHNSSGTRIFLLTLSLLLAIHDLAHGEDAGTLGGNAYRAVCASIALLRSTLHRLPDALLLLRTLAGKQGIKRRRNGSNELCIGQCGVKFYYEFQW